ncbi:MAG: aspartate 1-decarboxylase [Bacteriovorax sp.]|nr:aspartate 1-decarboxylase [Bacteriovorax sp.]
MLREVLQSKIHKATITEADIAYIGSITIDQDLLERIDLWPGQKVIVVSNTTGNRLETYVIAGARDSGMICMNGAAAHLIKKGDEVIIFSYAFSDRQIQPKCILVDAHNKYIQDL